MSKSIFKPPINPASTYISSFVSFLTILKLNKLLGFELSGTNSATLFAIFVNLSGLLRVIGTSYLALLGSNIYK